MDKYIWYQYTIQEITIIIPVEKKITGKDVKVKFDSKKLNVTIAGELILGGDLKFNMNVRKILIFLYYFILFKNFKKIFKN